MPLNLWPWLTARLPVVKPFPNTKVWTEHGALALSAPARRALINAKIYKLEDLATVSRSELKSLHGMGPSTLKVLVPAMEANGVSFRK